MHLADSPPQRSTSVLRYPRRMILQPTECVSSDPAVTVNTTRAPGESARSPALPASRPSMTRWVCGVPAQEVIGSPDGERPLAPLQPVSKSTLLLPTNERMPTTMAETPRTKVAARAMATAVRSFMIRTRRPQQAPSATTLAQSRHKPIPEPKDVANRCILRLVSAGGGGEIRTPGTFQYGGFQNRCLRPLGHSSVPFGASFVARTAASAMGAQRDLGRTRRASVKRRKVRRLLWRAPSFADLRAMGQERFLRPRATAVTTAPSATTAGRSDALLESPGDVAHVAFASAWPSHVPLEHWPLALDVTLI